jgi:hypothetical protein
VISCAPELVGSEAESKCGTGGAYQILRQGGQPADAFL